MKYLFIVFFLSIFVSGCSEEEPEQVELQYSFELNGQLTEALTNNIIHLSINK